MSKIRVIALREYAAAVRTKGFILGIILMPLLMGGGMVLQSATQNIVDTDTKRVAVIDRTPDQQLLPLLTAAAEKRNAGAVNEAGRPTKSPFEFVDVGVPNDAESLDAARLKVSQQIREGALFAAVEIGPDVLAPKKKTITTAPTDRTDAFAAIEATSDPDSLVYYASNRPTYGELREFIQQTLQPRIVAARLGESGISLDQVTQLFGTLVVPRGLAERDESGQLRFEPRQNQVALVALPLAMIMLMLVVVLVGASPLTTNIVEEKQLRIAEVLLGSVSPFQLMMGKLLGGVGTSLTLGAIYLFGSAVLAYRMDLLHLITPQILFWFIVFIIVASLMYGSLFIVAGAAATNIKEAQALVTPMMLIVVLPLFLAGPMINDPHGPVARFGTFFPLSAPLVTMLRLGAPPALPWWQPVLAMLSSGAMTVLLVWIAGRVFRAGFLLVGRPASVKELIGWILRG